jgi:hypothetical protein
MVNIYVILSILFFHWLFDFVFQTDSQAKGKSKEWGYLLEHTGIYSICWFVPLITYLIIFPYAPDTIEFFIPITFICHTATDYYTSRVNSQLLDSENTHGFFVSVGFDQFLHFVQLLLTFYLLT